MGSTSSTGTKDNPIEVDTEAQQMKESYEDSEDVDMILEVDAKDVPLPPSVG
jgi:hypothetical protein